MSQFPFDPELEQQLNDIDEFIRAQCGDDLTAGFNQSEWLLPSQAGEAPVQSLSSSWNIRGRSGNFILQYYTQAERKEGSKNKIT